jgi:ABC-type multidrug transport system ATPase subunit
MKSDLARNTAGKTGPYYSNCLTASWNLYKNEISMNQTSVDIKGVSRSYGDVRALEKISFQVERGELFGLIGPDGAGKTSLFRILTTLLLPDEGTARVEGFDVDVDYKEIRKITGYMPGRFSLYQDLTVEENLTFYATVFGTTVEENYDLIKDIYIQIEPFKKRRAGKLSGGMKQKLALSCALIHKPRVLILDEPTTGVDAVSRKEFWEMLLRLKGSDLTLLVSTPYMDEAELCDRVALLQEGRILSVNTPDMIREQYPHTLWSIRAENMYRLKNDLTGYADIRTVFLFGQDLHITFKESDQPDGMRTWLESKGHRQIQISSIEPGVEDCFMELMSSGKQNQM